MNIWQGLLAILGAILAITVLHIRDPRAAPLNVEQAFSIYVLAYGQYGSMHGGIAPMPPPPPVRLQSQAEICAYFGHAIDCPVYGYYVDGQITISETLDFSNPVDASKLLHEYVHYLQEQHGGRTSSCAQWLEREHEAYRVQMNVLMKVGEYMAARNVKMMASLQRCLE